MTLGPAALGMMLLWTIPDLIAAALGKVLPFWFYENQYRLLTVGATTSMFVFGSFFR